jgi:D-tyrosyl-tRNA(Tyr) deacylase
MRAVIQRVTDASVTVDGRIQGAVKGGLLVYLGVARGDTEAAADYLAEKIAALRIFPDEEGKMNRSVRETGGAILAVSQFTLLADARKGRRPSYSGAADPETARALYDYFIKKIKNLGLPCESGVFRTHMRVFLVNDGPVTILMDSEKTF